MEHSLPTPNKSKQASTEVLLLDGGLGTTLEDQFDTIFDEEARPLWSSYFLISEPSKLLAAHTAFVDSGADIILTATYQASFEGFASTKNPRDGKIGIPKTEAEDYMRQAVVIAQRAFRYRQARSSKNGKVALSLGAYGATMTPTQEYTGKYDEGHQSVSQLRDWHMERLSLFIRDHSGWQSIAFVAFETIPLLTEIVAVQEAIWAAQQCSVDSVDPEKPFWISCVFPGDELDLPDGSSVDEVVVTMLAKRDKAANPTAIGINCTKIGKIQGLLALFEESVRRMIRVGSLEDWPALVLYPDGSNGETFNTSAHRWEGGEGSREGLRPWNQSMFDLVKSTKDRRLWPSIIVGGCCKTTPRDIQRLRERLVNL